MKEKSMQTITRQETETPKEAAILTPKKQTKIDFNNIFKWAFIISTGIVLIPLYICITITKNLK